MHRTRSFHNFSRICCENLFDFHLCSGSINNSFINATTKSLSSSSSRTSFEYRVQSVPSLPRFVMNSTLFQRTSASRQSLHIHTLKVIPCLSQYLVLSRHVSGGKHPMPKIPPTKIMRHYDIHGTISSEDSAKQFVFALTRNERKSLLTELEKFRDLEQKVGQAEKPSRQQLKQVALHQTFPFIGFGFLDNLLMICFGEYIDVTLGTALGISTMAAAALGNLLSDVGGIGSASYVENVVTKMGVRAPQLSPEQVEMKITRWASSLGKAIGVSLGCLLGMFPLLFFSSHVDKEKEKESMDDK